MMIVNCPMSKALLSLSAQKLTESCPKRKNRATFLFLVSNKITFCSHRTLRGTKGKARLDLGSRARKLKPINLNWDSKTALSHLWTILHKFLSSRITSSVRLRSSISSSSTALEATVRRMAMRPSQWSRKSLPKRVKPTHSSSWMSTCRSATG